MAAEEPTIEEQWNQAQERDKRILRVPTTEFDLCTWVMDVAVSINGNILDTDQLDVDSFTGGYVLEEYFGPLQGAILMDALGTNNDCLIHSFLSCVCATFRRYDRNIRKTIASFFRRFIMIQLDGVTEANRNRLISAGFLETDELDILCKYYKLKFITLKRGQYPFDRHFGIVPITFNKEFWTNERTKNKDPFYVIHGSGAHFTPVAKRNNGSDNYEFNIPYDIILTLEKNITTAQHADANNDRIRKDETKRIMHEFINRNYDLTLTKSIIDNAATRDEKMAIISEIVADSTELIELNIDNLSTLSPHYRRDYAGQMGFEYIITTLTRDIVPTSISKQSPNVASSTSTSISKQSPNVASSTSSSTSNQSDYEPDMDFKTMAEENLRMSQEKEMERIAQNAELQKVLRNSESNATPTGFSSNNTQRAIELSNLDVLQSIQAGIEQAKGTSTTEAKLNNGPGSSQVTAMRGKNAFKAKLSDEIRRKIAKIFIKGIRKEVATLNPISVKQVKLSSRSMTASINNDQPTQYNVTIYEPLSSTSQGGKRHTKKANKAKKQKTKKLKKRTV
jgi:hypothetical protein